MVLLDMLAKRRDLTLVVAHVNHGIRSDAGEDVALVREAATRYDLPFHFTQVGLGIKASEDLARTVRYTYLYSLLARLGFDAIITAHHQDDLLETSVMHMLRGTGRRGLAGFTEQEKLLRPLVDLTKQDLRNYALLRHLAWHEDSTNNDTRYKRNSVRQQLNGIDPALRQALQDRTKEAAKLNKDIDRELLALLKQHVQKDEGSWHWSRQWFAQLPHEVAREVLLALLKHAGVQDVTRKRVEQLTVRLKTGKINTRYDCDKHWEIRIEQTPHRSTELTLALR